MDCISDEEKWLYARLDDWLYLCNKRSCPCFSDFLDLREQALIRSRLKNVKDIGWAFFGGYADAERAILVVYPDYYDHDCIQYPFVPVAFHYRKIQKLSHRDFLGTILSTGIRREKIGDILCGKGLSVVFLCEDVVQYICEQVDCVGGEGVIISSDYHGDLPVSRDYLEIRDSIASPRLDAIVKAIIRVYREESARVIQSGLISVDHVVVENVSKSISAPCTVSVRGYGRYLIDAIGPETKKGRLQLAARKCI